MAIELSQNPASAEQEPTQQEELKKQVQQGMNGNGQEMEMDNGHVQGQGELELHRACAGGNLDEVRGVLSRGLEQLEILDMNTGCTPIVLAIRGNFPEVVRELLSAGAIVPPPGLTNDPTMLSLLYPPMYAHSQGPPQFMHPQHMAMAPEFYPQQGFYDPRQQVQANLPPAEVAKTIPCRNFPNCKYGSSCVFLHPRAPFYPPGGPGFGYDGYQQFQPMPYFNPQANGFQPQQQIDESQPQFQSEMPQDNDAQSQQQPPQFNDQHSLSSAPAPFVPFGMTSPPPAQFGLSPMSPPMMPMPMSPHDAAAFFAQSPPNGMMPPLNGAVPFNPRRLSVNQHGFPKTFHGKKPSFSGGPRPWAGAGPRNPSAAGWKDGTPPPCAFFAQSKCRNGEFCKFPHLDNEGNDMRHPDVVRGVMAPAPPLAKVQRPMRASMGGFGFDPSRQFVPRALGEEQSQSTPVEAIPESAPVTESTPAEASTTGAQETVDQAEPPKSAQPTQVNGNGNGNAAISRSASQPGVQRFQHQQQNGFHSRAQSPAFHANGNGNGNGPRRAGRPFPNGNPVQQQQGARSVSAGGANKQRIPQADEFPALGGMSGSTSPQEKSVSAFSKTAAQVLSAPAPPKPEIVKDNSEDEVTMADESDSDAVIITMNKSSEKTKASPSENTVPVQEAPVVEEKKEVAPSAPAPAVSKPSTISFASVASAIKEISNSTSNGSIESAPVALKA